MFRILIAVFAALAAADLFYLITRFRRLLTGGRREKTGVKGWLLAAIPVAVIVLIGFRDPVNCVIVCIHLTVFWAAADLLGRLVRFCMKRRGRHRFYPEGILAIAITVIYLSAGWYLAHHVVRTAYEISTGKELPAESFRIVQISDSHMGTTFDGKGFAKHLERIQEEKPDLVVITGDYVDDDTTRQEMEEATAALGQLQTTCGIYYVFGNHDKGYFRSRDFTAEDLREALTENGIIILEDEVFRPEGAPGIVLIGRQDRSTRGRASMEELMEGIDKEHEFTIVLDHQPHDFAAQAAAGADLVLCGHTHGGQMIPIGWTGEISGANDRTYGLEIREGTTFIVNSGISDWAIRFKTGTVAEYGVIDLYSERQRSSEQ